jgi:catechol 2,3-dioxygenase-like lactoylglutathione lyase family enzyme
MAPEPPETSPGLELQPTVHVQDMAASVTFYERLGGEIVHGTRDGAWVLMQVGTTQINLVARPPDAARGESTVELAFTAAAPIEQLQRRLPDASLATDRDFGRQLQVRSPDGLLIKISQRAPDPYL